MGYIEGQNRNQLILFPESIDDYISDNSTVRVIDEYANQLDIEKLGFKRAIPSAIGRPSYDPRDILKLYIYGYLNRIRSSRRLEHEAIRNIEVTAEVSLSYLSYNLCRVINILGVEDILRRLRERRKPVFA